MSARELDAPDENGIAWPKPVQVVKNDKNSKGLVRHRGDKWDTLWRKMWARERAEVCKQLGISDIAEIQNLIDGHRLPEKIRVLLIQHFQQVKKEQETQVNAMKVSETFKETT